MYFNCRQNSIINVCTIFCQVEMHISFVLLQWQSKLVVCAMFGDFLHKVYKQGPFLQTESSNGSIVSTLESHIQLQLLHAITWFDQHVSFCLTLQELRSECARLRHNRGTRPLSAVAWSIQRYLMFAILLCIPDRQRTLRDLKFGETLIKEAGR